MTVEVNGQEVFSAFGQPNGTFEHPIPPLLPTDTIRVIGTDPVGNRQVKEKTLRDLFLEQTGPRAIQTPTAPPVGQSSSASRSPAPRRHGSRQ